MDNWDEKLSEVQAEIWRARGGTVVTDFAKKVQIAPATLQFLAKATTAQLLDWHNQHKSKGRAKASRAESLRKLYDFLRQQEYLENIKDPFEFAERFGFDPDDQHVKYGLGRSREPAKRTDTFVTHNDPTLDRIVAGDGRPKKELRAGILVWPPYCSSEGAAKNSFAGRMMTRLMGSLNPLEWGPPKHIALQFHEILSTDILRQGEVDAIFSLYDLPSRRAAGFDFIRIPGLAAPLGALVFVGPGTENAWIGWEQILDSSWIGGLDVVVVGRDAAQLLLLGACAYPRERIEVINPENKPNELNAHIADRLLSRAKNDAASRRRRSESPSAQFVAPFVFVADAAMVQQVERAFREQCARSEPSLQTNTFIVPTTDAWCPTYPIGIAVSANSARWHQILQDAMIRELFINSGPLTAKAYAELLAEPSSISLSPLDADLPTHTRDNFIATVKKEMNKILEQVDVSNDMITDNKIAKQDHIKRTLEKINSQWRISGKYDSEKSQ